MIITLRMPGGRSADVESEASDVAENLYVLAEAEFSLPMNQFRLIALGKVLSPKETLASQGVTNSCVVVVQTTLPAASPTPAVSNVDDQIRQLFGGPVQAPPPQSRAAPASPDQTILNLFAQSAAIAHQQQQQVPFDPDDPEIQRRLYEKIQQDALRENLEQAIEYTPEAFSRVVMLYIKAEVNKVPINVFVDSGAQTTIMSARIAERCNLTRFIDKRFSGIAKGVGAGKIIGRVHLAQVKLGNLFLPMSITVLEQPDMDFLLGLDQLKHHQMMIDLKKNVLRVTDEVELPFLAEHELDRTQRDVVVDEEGAAPATGNHPSDTPPRKVSRTSPPPQALSQEREVMVTELVGLSGGRLTRQQAIEMLEAAAWNPDNAAALLFDSA